MRLVQEEQAGQEEEQGQVGVVVEGQQHQVR
jgi:hypothetical protein